MKHDRQLIVLLVMAVALTLLVILMTIADAAPQCQFHAGGVLPDPRCTPGAANPALTKPVICDGVFRTRAYRHVTRAAKDRVFEAYGVSRADHGLYEVDHLIPLEAGGSNRVANLWPERWDGAEGARAKDRVENQAHRRLCAGGTLQDIQAGFRRDWRTLR